MNDPAATILELLASSTAPYTLHEHEPLVTVEDYESNTRFPHASMIKTLIFQAGDGLFMPVLCARARLDYAAAAAVAGVRRADLRLADAAEIAATIGWRQGGYAPFAVHARMRVVFDEGVRDLTTVFCGTGRADLTLEIASMDLFRLVGADFAHLART